MDIWKLMRLLQSVEVVEKVDGGLLILKRILMRVVALVHGDAVGMAEARIELGDLTERLVCAFNGKEIQHGCGDEDGPRVHQKEQSGMV